MPTLKDRKRILNKDGTPAKVVQKLDQSPLFRQNGYNLKFDAVNSDYIDLGDSPTISKISELQLKTKITFENGSFGSRYLFSLGKRGIGFTQVLFYFSGTSLGVLINIDNVTVETKFTSIAETGVITKEFELNDLDIIIDGEVKTSLNTDWDVSFDQTNLFTYAAQNTLTGNFLSNTTEYIEVQNQFFLPSTKGYGATIIGSNGTVITINTSSAQSTNYINTEVWQKNSFALGFDAVNQEYLGYQFNGLTIASTSDIDIEFSFYIDSFSGGRIRLLHLSESETSGGSRAFWFETNTNRSEILFRQSNSDGSISSNATNLGVPVLGVNTVSIKNSLALFNGNASDLSALNKIYTLNIQNPFLNFSRFLGTSSYSNSVLTSLSVQGEDFSLKIGLGTKITGSNGNELNINTNAAQSKERINFGMHLKGNDIDGFTPYTKD
jgi:hypothetical protein